MSRTLDNQIGIAVRQIAYALTRESARGSVTGRLGSNELRYIQACTVDSDLLGVRMIFTRDTGHHASGWFKNPDYERCRHLSISPRAKHPGQENAPDPIANIERLLLPAFFGDGARFAWFESAKSAQGKQREVRHWRVFCNEAWEPIHPRGEVYSKEFTEIGWKSASELGVTIVSPLNP